MSNDNQYRQYAGLEQANDMLISGQVGSRDAASGAQQRYEQYSQPAGNQSSNYQQSNGQQQQLGGQQQLVGQQYGVPQLSFDQLRNEYLSRFPKAYGQPIVAVKKDGRGNLVAFRLANGHVLDYAQMLQAGFDGALDGVVVQNNREGELILRSVPDGYRSNNLDQLPEFQ